MITMVLREVDLAEGRSESGAQFGARNAAHSRRIASQYAERTPIRAPTIVKLPAI